MLLWCLAIHRNFHLLITWLIHRDRGKNSVKIHITSSTEQGILAFLTRVQKLQTSRCIGKTAALQEPRKGWAWTALGWGSHQQILLLKNSNVLSVTSPTSEVYSALMGNQSWSMKFSTCVGAGWCSGETKWAQISSLCNLGQAFQATSCYVNYRYLLPHKIGACFYFKRWSGGAVICHSMPPALLRALL